jgi:hypothetical protein
MSAKPQPALSPQRARWLSFALFAAPAPQTPAQSAPPSTPPAAPSAARPSAPPAPAREGPADVGVPLDLPLDLRLERRDGDGGPALEPIGGGRLRHRNPRFTATIAADGSVEFRDTLPTPRPTLFGVDLVDRRLRPPRPDVRDDFEARALYPTGPPTAAVFAGVGGGLPGLADLLARGRRRDGGAHLAEKRRFLADTEGLRARMHYTWLKGQLEARLEVLLSQVIAAWNDPALPLHERKRRLFRAWDDCEPAPGAEPVDRLRADVARRARDKLEALARVLAPPTSPQRFTPDELAALNATRRSAAPFDPYRAP